MYEMPQHIRGGSGLQHGFSGITLFFFFCIVYYEVIKSVQVKFPSFCWLCGTWNILGLMLRQYPTPSTPCPLEDWEQ